MRPRQRPLRVTNEGPMNHADKDLAEWAANCCAYLWQGIEYDDPAEKVVELEKDFPAAPPKVREMIFARMKARFDEALADTKLARQAADTARPDVDRVQDERHCKSDARSSNVFHLQIVAIADTDASLARPTASANSLLRQRPEDATSAEEIRQLRKDLAPA
jgi:hypothetical protein